MLTPTENSLFNGQHAKSLSAGKEHAAAVDQHGTLFTWGCTKGGRLGRKSFMIPVEAGRDVPNLVDGPLSRQPCRKVACGAGFTAAVTESGELYTFGFGGRGALGHGDLQSEEVPRRVEGLPAVVDVACAGVAAAVTVNGEMYVWGESHYVGFGTGTDAARPRLVCGAEGAALGSERVRAVSVGPQHAVALGRRGRVVAWGRRTLLPFLGDAGGVVKESVRAVCCGDSCTALLGAQTRFEVDEELLGLMLRSLFLWYVENNEERPVIKNAMENAQGEVRGCVCVCDGVCV